MTRNEESDWPSPAVSPKNQGKSLPNTADGQKNDEIFQKESRRMKTMRKILQIGGMILSCPNYRKMMLEKKTRALQEGNIISGLIPTQTTQKTSDTKN